MSKDYLVVTVVGPDKRGIVAKVSELVYENRSNITESKMSRLGGEFAVIMLVETPSEHKDKLLAALETLKAYDLTIITRLTDLSRVKVFEGFVPYEISVIGADHEGIVHTVAEYLANARIQVEEMETEVVPAPVTGTPLFSMRTEVQVPPEISLPELREKLNELGDNLGVDIDVRLPIKI